MPEEVIDNVVLEPVEGQEEQPQAQPPAEGEQPPKPAEVEKPKGPIQLVEGTKLNAAVRTALSKVATGDPAVDRAIRDAVYKQVELQKVFPGGINEARELSTKIEGLGGIEKIEEMRTDLNEFGELAQAFQSGSPAFIQDLLETSPEAFAKFVPGALEKLADIDLPTFCKTAEETIIRYAQLHPAGFDHIFSRVIAQNFRSSGVELALERLADQIEGNGKAVGFYNQVVAYFDGFLQSAAKTPEAPKPSEKQPPAAAPKEPEKKALADTFQNDWQKAEGALFRKIGGPAYREAIANLQLDDEDRMAFDKDVMARLQYRVSSQEPTFKEKSQRFIDARDKNGFLRYRESLYKRFLPAVIGIVAAKRAGSAAKSAAAAPQKAAQPVEKPPARPGVPSAATVTPAGSKLVSAAPKPSEIDFHFGKTTSAMLQRNQAFLKNGTRVHW